jgi:hypothetical protein
MCYPQAMRCQKSEIFPVVQVAGVVDVVAVMGVTEMVEEEEDALVKEEED